jgi:inner membrane protein involved in colicin E2 resistance
VSLLFFFVVLVVIQVLRGWRLHPLHYLQLAAAFFAFHVLLAYLVDHVPLEPAFWIAAATSMLLVVSYLRLVLGARAAILVAGGAQLAYLVLFSYAFFWEGVTGLTIVLGGIGTLFLVMQLTGRLDWDRVLGGEDPAPATGG